VVSRRRQRIVISTIACMIAFGAIAELSGGYPGLRYFYPVVPILFGTAAAGVAMIYRASARDTPNALPVIAVVVTIASVASICGVWAQQPRLPLPRYDIARGLGRLSALAPAKHAQLAADDYRSVLTAWLAAHAKPDDFVALDEIGLVAYQAGTNVIDLWGLGDAHIANLPGVGGRKADANYVFARAPRFMAFMYGKCACAALIDDGVYAQDPRMASYDLVLVVPATSRPGVLLYERRAGVARAISLDRAGHAVAVSRRPVLNTMASAKSPLVLATVGDLLRRKTLRAIPLAGHSTEPVAIGFSVPPGAVFEAELGDVAAHSAGTWTFSIREGDHTSRLGSVRTPSERVPTFARRVAINLRHWAGHRVTMLVTFTADCHDNGCHAFPLLAEPQLVR
jgi:hypothetical protein